MTWVSWYHMWVKVVMLICIFVDEDGSGLQILFFY